MNTHKIMMLTVALMITAGVALFASGAAEVNEGTWQPGMGRSTGTARGGFQAPAQGSYGRGGQVENRGNNEPGSRFTLYTEGETVTLTGELVEVEGEMLFSSDGNVMTISAPGYPRTGFIPQAGTKLTVEGELHDPLETCPVESEGHLIVTAAEIDGERYEFGTPAAPGAGRGGANVASAGSRFQPQAGAKGRSAGRGRAW